MSQTFHEEATKFFEKFDVELKTKQNIVEKWFFENPIKERLADILAESVGLPFEEKD